MVSQGGGGGSSSHLEKLDLATNPRIRLYISKLNVLGLTGPMDDFNMVFRYCTVAYRDQYLQKNEIYRLFQILIFLFSVLPFLCLYMLNWKHLGR